MLRRRLELKLSLSVDYRIARRRGVCLIAADMTPTKFRYGATMSTCRIPMPSTSPSTLSPGFKNTGGTRAKPTPDGVPVLIMSPGSNVKPADKLSIVVGMSKIMSRVLPSCITSPLTRQISRTCCGSGRALL